MAKKFKTRITEMLGIEYPIISGGMQWLSRAELVAAVANAGAIGFMTAESFETPEDLREEIKKMLKSFYRSNKKIKGNIFHALQKTLVGDCAQ